MTWFHTELGRRMFGKWAARGKAGHRARRCGRAQRRAEALEPRQMLASGGVSYQGGPVINNVAVETVFLGTAWTTDPTLQQNAAQLDQFFGYLTNSSFMDLLAQYGTPQAGPIGQGSFSGQVNIAQNDWQRSTISDPTIQNVLNSQILSGTVPQPDSNQLLFVFTPPNIVVSQGGTRSNGYPTGFAGYHNSFVDSAGQLVRYAVIPDPIGNDQVPGLTTFQQQTEASSHELAEAVTDPDGTGWWDNSNDATSGYEIADFANINTDTVYLNGYAVEEVLSNAAGGLAAPAGATLSPTATIPSIPPVTIPPVTTPPITTPPASSIPANLGQVAVSLTHDSQYYASFVASAYQHYLGRATDANGLNYWVTQMQLGTTDEQLEAELLASPEYAALQGSTDASWIAGMYQDLLGRTVDGPGLSYWLTQLQAGATRYEIALGIAMSPEREAMVVTGDYQTYLGRGANAAEISYWVNAFEFGAHNEDLIAEFLASPEYYNSSSKGQGSNTAWVDSVFEDLYQTPPSADQLAQLLAELG
ncbi:MAG TPA: DUF4214 domain-containing protein [Pirellulales bacterium]|nr:DUF4214 domain-containing protein [Pirellulales bacterium]